MPDFLTTISWLSPSVIGIGVGIAALIVIAGYLYWAWSEKQWPFGQ